MSTKLQLIQKFRLFYDDQSPLSTAEESDLFEKIYQQICADRPWEFLKTQYSGVQSTSVPYVALPSDFAYLVENADYDSITTESKRPRVFVGTNRNPVEIISYSTRNQYANNSAYAYIDIANSRLYFSNQPTSADTITFDYIKVPAALADGESPIFPARFHDMIPHGMVVDVNLYEQTDKAKSYAAENMKRYSDYLKLMAYWNAQLITIS